MQRFQSILQFKKVSCKNCYKCVRNCPVKAIRVHDHQARIIESQCIYCEKCILVCPQDAKEEQNMIPAICNAKAMFQQYVSQAENGAKGFNGLALCDIEDGDYDSALSDIESGIHVAGAEDMQSLLFNEIVVYEKKLDFQTALQKAQEYLELYPEDKTVKKELAFLKTRV